MGMVGVPLIGLPHLYDLLGIGLGETMTPPFV